MALDYAWFTNGKSYSYLMKTSPFFESQWKSKKDFSAVYSLSGNKLTSYGSVSNYSGPLALFSVVDKNLAKDIFETLYEKPFREKSLAKDSNYYDQNWSWFAVALYSGKTVNYWN